MRSAARWIARLAFTIWIGWACYQIGMIEGRQSVEVVACVETPNEVVRRKAPERVRVVP